MAMKLHRHMVVFEDRNGAIDLRRFINKLFENSHPAADPYQFYGDEYEAWDAQDKPVGKATVRFETGRKLTEQELFQIRDIKGTLYGEMNALIEEEDEE